MKTVLIVYDSRSGHTARIARCIRDTIIADGHQADMFHVIEADREGIDWNKYDLVIAGAPVLYGKFRHSFLSFVNKWKAVLDDKPNSFFNVSVVARTPAKATPEGNVYAKKFLANNPWQPKDVKCFAGKVDYPNWTWLDAKLIQMIMKMTKGPTEPTAVIDYTDWDAVKEYALHCLTIEQEPAQPDEAADTEAAQA